MKHYIFFIPDYLNAFSLCESGKDIDYVSDSVKDFDFQTGDKLVVCVGSDEVFYRYAFQVVSQESDTLRLKKIFEIVPGYSTTEASSELNIVADNTLTLISEEQFKMLLQKMMLSGLDEYKIQLPLNALDETSNELTDLENRIIRAIRTKPFVLLAGISGTGKSRIVRQLAKACWPIGSDENKAHKPSNFEMVQVKPNWHDSSELLGYVSRINDKPKFIVGDLLKFIAKAWENPETPYFLCLDEMNLAPVEQYFAEYLSVIESRKLQDDKKTILTDPILKKESGKSENGEWYQDLCNSITADEILQHKFLEEGISIPQNLIVIGTVNMDETTYSFSRKVLDRAMTIEMNEVDLEGGLDKSKYNLPHVKPEHLLADTVEGYDVYHKEFIDDCNTVIKYLGAVNYVLANTPFRVAYRTRNEFLIYVVNAIRIAGKDANRNKIIADALDEVTSMKILSRIEGDKRKVHFLGELKKTVKTELDKIDKGDRSEANSTSLAKLKAMSDRLNSGYTSFWD